MSDDIFNVLVDIENGLINCDDALHEINRLLTNDKLGITTVNGSTVYTPIDKLTGFMIGVEINNCYVELRLDGDSVIKLYISEKECTRVSEELNNILKKFNVTNHKGWD